MKLWSVWMNEPNVKNNQNQFQAFQSRIITLSVYFTLLRENNEKINEILNL